jgi:hypothetical protein
MYQEFWAAFLAQLRLDDQLQRVPNPAREHLLWFALPTRAAWIIASANLKHGKAGVYLGIQDTQLGDAVFDFLDAQHEELDNELPPGTSWRSASNGRTRQIEIWREFPELHDKTKRQDVFEFLAKTLNAFVNSFRHRLAAFEEQQKSAE